MNFIQKTGAVLAMVTFVVAPFHVQATWFEKKVETVETEEPREEVTEVHEEESLYCELGASVSAVDAGNSVQLSWSSEGFVTATLQGESVSPEGGSREFAVEEDTNFVLVTKTRDGDTCEASAFVRAEHPVVEEEPEEDPIEGCTDEAAVNYHEEATEDNGSCEYHEEEPEEEEEEEEEHEEEEEPEETGECKLSVDKWVSTETATQGAELSYTIKVYNYGTADCTGGGVMIRDHLDTNFVYHSYEIDGEISAGYGDTPVYDAAAHSLYFNGHTLVPGEGGRITVHGTVADIDSCEDFTVENTAKATARELANFTEWSYSDTVTTVIEGDDCTPVTPAPICESFSASQASVPYTGGDVTLTWDTTNATNVTIYPTLGVVAADGTDTAFVSFSTKFLLTATNAAGDEVTCDTTVLVDPTPEVFTCENNVLFTASQSSLTEGQSSTLDWTVNDADTVAIDVINESGLTGSRVVTPADDTTYTLTATKDDDSISCPLTISVTEEPTTTTGGGGGGGGTATPRCELDASATSISAGDSVRLSWDTSNAREVTLIDENDDVIFTTDDYLSSEKDDFYDYAVSVNPTEDTTYTLIVERGSRDRECTVDIEVEDNIVVLETRDQQPLVASISLTDVPYTGFEAGTFASFLFYLLLVLWALYITYVFVIRKDEAVADVVTVSPTVATMQKAEALRPDLFPTMNGTVPANLPTIQKKSHLGW